MALWRWSMLDLFSYFDWNNDGFEGNKGRGLPITKYFDEKMCKMDRGTSEEDVDEILDHEILSNGGFGGFLH